MVQKIETMSSDEGVASLIKSKGGTQHIDIRRVSSRILQATQNISRFSKNISSTYIKFRNTDIFGFCEISISESNVLFIG